MPRRPHFYAAILLVLMAAMLANAGARAQRPAGATFTAIPTSAPTQTPFIVTSIPTPTPVMITATPAPAPLPTQQITPIETQSVGANPLSIVLTALATAVAGVLLGVPAFFLATTGSRNEAKETETNRRKIENERAIIANKTLEAAQEGAAKAGQTEIALATQTQINVDNVRRLDEQKGEITRLNQQVLDLQKERRDLDSLADAKLNTAVAAAIAPFQRQIEGLETTIETMKGEIISLNQKLADKQVALDKAEAKPKQE